MGSRLRTAARDALATWGALSLIGLIAAAGFLAYSFYFPGTPLDDRASKDDVRFVLNRPGLGDERIESVVRSHESVVHVNGDHFVAYAIRVTSLSESELSAEKRWVRADRADALMNEAIRFVTTAGHDAPWFPAADELLTDRYFVWRERVEVTDRVTAAVLIFARPSDRMVFYASLQV